ncbi:MAG: ABC transporter ATP-binding protein [Sandaracinaceae bacterium]
MIEVENLTKRYGSHEAVRGLTFEVPNGQICGFLGPNGAGKSTTLRMLTGFLTPTGGSVKVGGIDALAEPIAARRHIGYMPEACPLYPEMRVTEYLRYRAALKEVPRAQVAGRVEAALEQANVTDVRDRIIGQLSKGYRQRVGLADALVADPPLLVLDEPTAGLDPNQIRQVRELITELAKNKTVLLSTHILPEVEAICDRVLIIHKGKMVSEGEPGSLQADLVRRELIRLEGRGTVGAWKKALQSVPGVRVSKVTTKGSGLVKAKLEADHPDAVEAVFAVVVQAGLVLRELRREEASLEDVFRDLTTSEAEADTPSEAPPAREEEE